MPENSQSAGQAPEEAHRAEQVLDGRDGVIALPWGFSLLEPLP